MALVTWFFSDACSAQAKTSASPVLENQGEFGCLTGIMSNLSSSLPISLEVSSSEGGAPPREQIDGVALGTEREGLGPGPELLCEG